MSESVSRSFGKSLGGVILGAVASAMVSAALAVGLWVLMITVIMGARVPGVTDGMHVIWLWLLAPLAAVVGAVAGGFVFGLRPLVVRPTRWLIIALVAVVLDVLVGVVGSLCGLRATNGILSIISFVIAGIAFPIAASTGSYALLCSDNRQTAVIARVALGALLLVLLILGGALYASWMV